MNWDRNTKKCSLQINGIRQVDSWLDNQCGKGCQFDQLEYLGIEQVGQAATQGDGVRFKVMDDSVSLLLTDIFSSADSRRDIL